MLSATCSLLKPAAEESSSLKTYKQKKKVQNVTFSFTAYWAFTNEFRVSNEFAFEMTFFKK